MKKVKFKHRIDNAVEAFFADGSFNEDRMLVHSENAALTRTGAVAGYAATGDWLVGVLKRFCLFFPGTFFLLLTSFAGSMTFARYGFPRHISFRDLAIISFIFLTAGFSTWFGLGDLKNPKHSIIPLTIISIGTAAGLVCGVLPKEIFGELDFHTSWTYFLPLALVTAFLAKGFVDRKS